MKSMIPSITCIALSIGTVTSALAQGPDMGSYWPSEDGRSWRYDQHFEEFAPVPDVLDNQVRLFFDGTTVAPNGIDAQVLREALVGGAASRAALAAAIPDPLLRSIWVARPDLRARILQSIEMAPCPTGGGVSQSILLGGERAFRKTADEVAAWRCNADDTRSWLWLVSNLTIGNTFSLPLIPDLADDVVLHGTIAQIEDVTVPAGSYANCLRVDYRIDFGTSACVDDAGSPTGTARGEKRGSIHFAPSVGPVRCYEEFIPYAEATGTCADPADIGRVFAIVTLQLNSAPVPVRATTWGRLKTTYR